MHNLEYLEYIVSRHYQNQTGNLAIVTKYFDLSVFKTDKLRAMFLSVNVRTM